VGFNPIAAAIPVFFVCIGVEAALARWQGRSVYRFNDAIADLSCGITSQVAGVFTKGLTLAAYLVIWSDSFDTCHPGPDLAT
jgi:alkylglycerol monooxygenase